jgi:hypothetical protein
MIYTGSVKLESLKRSSTRKKIDRPTLRLADTCAVQAINIPETMQNPEIEWYRGKHVLSHAGDECAVATWIFARSPFSSVRQHLAIIWYYF